MPEHNYEVILPNGDRAEADDADTILLAARTLASEAAEFYGHERALRRDVIVTSGGVYDGALTEAARNGWLSSDEAIGAHAAAHGRVIE